MKLNYYIVNPGGNITAIVCGKFSKKIKLLINKKILEKAPTVEQVGFWINSNDRSIDARFEMAGGEFCGNALRSLGALLASEKQKDFYLVKSSSVRTPIVLNSSTKLSAITLKLSLFESKGNICSIPGITHIISKNKFTKLTAKKLLSRNKLLENKAAGVINYTCVKDSIYAITPFVYVRDTQTIYEETSCASGSLALAYMIYKKIGTLELDIQQPSGFALETLIKNGEIRLSGKVISIKKENMTI